MTTGAASGSDPSVDGLRRFLRALYAHTRPGLFIELRLRAQVGMAQRFVPVDRLDAVEELVLAHGSLCDVYLGVLARWRAGGGRGDLAGGCRVVWVDCDGPQAVRALEPVDPEPAIVVASGTQGHRHAYWLLRRAVAPAVIERANRRLAWALGADLAATDATRILRPPATLNHKHHPPTPVRLEHLDPTARVSLGELIGGLPDPPPEHAPRRQRQRRPRRPPGDRLLTLAPAVYVERLTGQPVPRDRKVRCPLHDDHDPSLHVYADPARGWYCFGCRRGGSVYDLASLLWQIPARGRGFHDLRGELQRRLAA